MLNWNQMLLLFSTTFSVSTFALGTTVMAQSSGHATSSQPNPIAELEQFIVRPGHEATVRQALLGMVQATRAEHSNLAFEVFVSRDNPDQYFTWDLWEDGSAADAHDRSDPELATRPYLLAPPSRSRARMLSQLDTGSAKKHPTGSPTQFTLVPFFIAKEGKVEAMRKAHLAMIGPTRSEPGNIDYDLFASVESPNVMFLFENWDNKEALNVHMAKPYFTRYVRGQADAAAVVPWTYLTLQMISPPKNDEGAQR